MKMDSMLKIRLLFFVGSLIQTTRTQFTCPANCQCVTNSNSHYDLLCEGGTVTGIPNLNATDAIRVDSLYLLNGLIPQLDPLQLQSYTNIKRFLLENCQTEVITIPFQSNSNLNHVTIRNNQQLLYIATNIFQDLSLNTLNLEENQLSTYSFIYESNISTLVLAKNNISQFSTPTSRSSMTSRIQTLDLSYNYITQLNHSDFSFLPILETLDISYNLLTEVSQDILTVFNRLSSINIEGNLLHCNCDLRWLKLWYDSNTFSKNLTFACTTPVPRYFKDISSENFQCVAPVLVSQSGGGTVVVNSNISMSCLATGDPAPEITFHKFREPSNACNLNIEKTQTMTYAKCVIVSVSENYTSHYEWSIRNNAGLLNVPTQLVVIKPIQGTTVTGNNAGAIAGAIFGGIFIGILICAIIILIIWLHNEGKLTCCANCPCCKKPLLYLQSKRETTTNNTSSTAQPQTNRPYIEMSNNASPQRNHNRPRTIAGTIPEGFISQPQLSSETPNEVIMRARPLGNMGSVPPESNQRHSLTGMGAAHIYDTPYTGTTLPRSAPQKMSEHHYQDVQDGTEYEAVNVQGRQIYSNV